MDRAHSPSKVPIPLCDVKEYYSSGFSSTSLKQAVQSEIETKSSNIVVVSVMTIGTFN